MPSYTFREPIIRTATGRFVHLLEPTEDSICIEDIAHHLENICRFTGACSPRWTVAQHSILVARLCCPEAQLYGLLHDASEAYLGDIATPLKYSGMMDEYLKLELQMEQVIAKALRLKPAPWILLEVKNADEEAFQMEWAAFMEGDYNALTEVVKHTQGRVFLEEYKRLSSAEYVRRGP